MIKMYELSVDEMVRLSEIMLRRKSMVVLPETLVPSDDGANKIYRILGSMIKNMESYGFIFSERAINVLLKCSPDQIKEWYMEVVEPVMRINTGADHRYTCMYPNFPWQVMEATDGELLINTLIHYFTFGKYIVQSEVQDRTHLFMNPNELKVIDVCSDFEITELFKNLVSSKTSLSDKDIEDLDYIYETKSHVFSIDDDLFNKIDVPNKENLARLTIMTWKHRSISSINLNYKTATDVLRLVTAMSNGDVSLATNTKFVNISRSNRRKIMTLLMHVSKNDTDNILEDMWRYRERWLRIGEIIHPSTFKADKYNCVREAFNSIRNRKNLYFFANKVDDYLKSISEDFGEYATLNMVMILSELLKTHPGEFARRLDSILRVVGNLRNLNRPVNIILGAFSEVSDKVSVPVLMQVYTHFKYRNRTEDDTRVFFPKGNVAKAVIIEDCTPTIQEPICGAVCLLCERAIYSILSNKKPLGKVYIDENLKNFNVPFALRSASKSSKIVTRGSRIKVSEDVNFIRPFIWWTNTDGDEERVDLDLSVLVVDSTFNVFDRISYSNLRDNEIGAYHSGDIVDGGPIDGKGTAEFIDIDINKVSDKCYRYIIFNVNSFTGQKFNEMKNCCFGWMNRNGIDDGEIFEPSTVDMKIDMNQKSTVAVPVIFDCKEREFIWCDMNVDANKMVPINIENNKNKVTDTVRAILNMKKPTIYDLVLFNAAARGVIVNNKSEAHIIFSVDDATVFSGKDRPKWGTPIYTPYDVDYYIGQMM